MDTRAGKGREGQGVENGMSGGFGRQTQVYQGGNAPKEEGGGSARKERPMINQGRKASPGRHGGQVRCPDFRGWSGRGERRQPKSSGKRTGRLGRCGARGAQAVEGKSALGAGGCEKHHQLPRADRRCVRAPLPPRP